MKSYTDIEQSKKLLELGLNPESADMYFSLWEEDHNFKEPYMMKSAFFEWNKITVYDRALPCWSLGALLEVMPKHIFSEDGIKNYTPVLHIGEKKVVWYQRMNEFLHIEHADTSIEAAYSMVVWLLENGFIEKEPKTSN